jgi:hypothetical protein
MDRKFFTYFLLLISGSLSGQVQGYYSTDFWKKYTTALAFDLKLEPLSLQKTNFHYRFWTIGQVINIWKDDSGLHGDITNYAKEYDEMNLGKRTFFSSKLPIEKSTSTGLYQLILSSNLLTIPTGDAIDGWGKITDGFTYITECSDSGKYSFKCYLSPGQQGSLKEAITIQSFIVRLEQNLKLKKSYKSFSASIPFWCYTKGTTEVTCRKK